MHLGLYTRARKDLQAKEREYARILARRAEKAARSVDGDEADEQIYFRSPSQSPSPSPTNGRPRSHSPTPGSAPRASSKSPIAHAKPSSPSKAAQKLHDAVGRADIAGARIEYQAAAVQHDLRASAEGGWNSSTNDNVLNSSHNPGRPHSAYDARRAYAPAYAKVLDSVAKSKEDGGGIAGKVRPKSSTGIGRADPKKVATPSAQPKTERNEHKQDKQEKAERMEKLAKSTEFVQAAAATERPASPKKHEFTLYDVKEKTREFFHYPAGSFRNTGDLIDFQALAVQQSVKQGNAKPRAQSARAARHGASKPVGVFPGVENGPEWVKFPKSEELTRSYSESKGLTSPGRSRSMKKLSAMRKNVSFGAQSKAEKESTTERAPSPVALQRPPTGQISPKNISPRPLSRNRSENRPEELKFDASEFVEAGNMLERATSQVPFSGRRSPPFDGTGTATPASMQDGSYLSADPDEEEKEPDEESEASVSSEEPENDVNHAIRGLHVKSHSGLDTRSSSIFHKVEIAPRLVGNSVEDLLALGGTCYVPDIYEVSVFDVGYVLPCSNNTILFSAQQSAENAQILTQKERMRMRNSFVGMNPAVLGASAKNSSSKNKPKLVKCSESQVPGESLSIKLQSADAPYLPTTYGILVEVIAKPQFGASSSAPSSPHPAAPLGKSTSSDHESHASSLHYHHHHHRHNPATYAYKLIPLRELLDIALAANNDDMCTLLHEMLHFGYKFGQMNNSKAASPIHQARLLHRSQCEMMGDTPPPDHILFNDQRDVVIYPCMFNMLDRHVKRSLSMLIKNNLEVLFSTDLQRVSIGIKY